MAGCNATQRVLFLIPTSEAVATECKMNDTGYENNLGAPYDVTAPRNAKCDMGKLK